MQAQPFIEHTRADCQALHGMLDGKAYKKITLFCHYINSIEFGV